MANVTDFYAGHQNRIVFLSLKTQHSEECYFKSAEERDKYLDKLDKFIDVKNLDENVTL